MAHQKDENRAEPGWAERPGPQRLIRIALYWVCAGLLLADFVVHRHVEHPVEGVPAFYVLYGFLALMSAVAGAKALRRLVKRDEDYYRHDV